MPRLKPNPPAVDFAAIAGRLHAAKVKVGLSRPVSPAEYGQLLDDLQVVLRALGQHRAHQVSAGPMLTKAEIVERVNELVAQAAARV